MSQKVKKVLIVDDEYEIVELVKAILKTRNFDVSVAYDGEEGWQKLMEERPDLVILDLRMPKMSGLEFCKKARTTPEVADTALLVISSLTTGTDKPDQFWAAGLKSDDFLPKPFDPLSLLGRVEYLLRKEDYVSSSGSASTAPSVADGASKAPRPAQADQQERSPEDVVRTFIESWNTQDFKTEYDTLGDEMLGGLTRNEYIARRVQLYADEQGRDTKHELLDAEANITHNLAFVTCLREDTIGGAPRRKEEKYTLRKTDKGWKIVSVKSKPIAFSIE